MENCVNVMLSLTKYMLIRRLQLCNVFFKWV